MLKRNLEITQKEKDKRGFSLSNNKNPRGPIINNQDNIDDNNENNDDINQNNNGN